MIRIPLRVHRTVATVAAVAANHPHRGNFRAASRPVLPDDDGPS